MAATYGEGVYGNGVGVTTPLSHKMAQVTEFTKTTTANLIRPGVLYNGNASLVTGRANMAYDVAPFSIVTTRGATSGAVKWANDGTVTVSTTAAPGSNSRIDVIYAWHREYSIDGVDSNPVIGVVQGTAAASPTVPSLAAFPGAVELARVTIPAGVTATNSGTTFTQTAPFTSTDGAPVPFRTKTEMDLWTTALTNQRAIDLSTGFEYVRFGSVWGRGNVGNRQLDTTNSTVAQVTQVGNGIIAGNGTAFISETVTFPVPFSGTPIITVSSNGSRNGVYDPTGGLNPGAVFATHAAKSTTGFTVGLAAPGAALSAGVNWYYDWIAVGPA